MSLERNRIFRVGKNDSIYAEGLACSQHSCVQNNQQIHDLVSYSCGSSIVRSVSSKILKCDWLLQTSLIPELALQSGEPGPSEWGLAALSQGSCLH